MQNEMKYAQKIPWAKKDIPNCLIKSIIDNSTILSNPIPLVTTKLHKSIVPIDNANAQKEKIVNNVINLGLLVFISLSTF